MNVPDAAALGAFLSPAFWSVLSFTLALAFTWWFLKRPRKGWVLVVTAACIFVLFDFGGFPWGLTGFFAAVGLRLWNAFRIEKAGRLPRRRK